MPSSPRLGELCLARTDGDTKVRGQQGITALIVDM